MSVPSFPSFPAFTTFPDLDPGPSTRTSAALEDREKDKKHRRKDRRDDDHEPDAERRKKKHRHDKPPGREERSDDRHKHTRRSRSHEKRKDRGWGDDERKKAEEDRRNQHDESDIAAVKESLVYFTDRKGDPLNVRYGSLHAGDVPKHRLVDRGRKVLGLGPGLVVIHRGRAGVEVGYYGRRRMPELTDSSTRRVLAAGPSRRLIASSEDKFKYQEEDGFLRITTNRPRHDDQSYREIELSKQYDRDSDESDDSAESESSDDDSDTTPVTSLQATLKSLEERLSAKPDDISAWLSLLSHTLTTVTATSKNLAKARTEITTSVLSRALEAHPDNSRSKILRLKYMKAGEELWQADKLYSEWEKAVKVDDIEIWMAWLDWRVRNTNDALASLAEDVARVVRAPSLRQDEIGQLRVLWRAAVVFREAGYTERANALLQAQGELLYHLPPTLSSGTFENHLDSLEEFWDSEVPRMGEPSATGWAAWEASNRPEHPPPAAPGPVNPDPRIPDPYSRWAASETVADRVHALSLRTTDDDENADPYAVVLFSDIRPLLVNVRSPRAKDVFRHIWLAFSGLHVPGFLASLSERPEENMDDRWAYTHLASQSYLGSVFPGETSAGRITADAFAGVLVGREREYGSGFGPVKNWGYGAIEPFENLGSGKWSMWTKEDVQGVDQGPVREIFKQCRISGNDAEWDVLHLAFEAAINLKSALKLSKSLLATARDSLPHWAAHARMERLRCRPDDARKVYQTVLSASSQSRVGEGALWWDWAEMEWLSRNDDGALQVIVRSSGVAGSGGIAVLRAKRHFEDLLTTQLLRASWKERAPWIKLAALLELVTSSPESALGVLDHYLNQLEHGTPAHEALTVASLALLYNHSIILRKPTPPALLRERAERAIEDYPSNTAILGVFLEAEKGQGIWGRVRATLGETAADGTGKEKGVARRVAEVWVAGWEKGRWEAEIERTRSGLSAAAEDERTRGSAVVWKVFIAFELRAGQPERAKKLLFRAIGECPLAKELYLLAFGPLRAVFSARELNGLGDTMAERGVRTRVGLDEVVGEWTDGRGEGEEGASGPGGEDEIEKRAEELRRLMPY
ncbi:NRDE-2, necessary for RNA interference-domain-containing protein [Trametes maxima]|nr:NRDE-2, necessary for RNA interference-domain-containing protein [Trametes maxima]